MIVQPPTPAALRCNPSRSPRGAMSTCTALVLAAIAWVAAPHAARAGCPPGQEEDEQGLCKPKGGAKPKPAATPKPAAGPTSKPTPQPTAAPSAAPPQPARATCEGGRQPATNAPSQCCWPGQLWSTERSACLGSPTSCPAGTLVEGDRCVTTDGDGDGVFLPADLCPAQKEDADGFEDGDGCPEPGPTATNPTVPSATAPSTAAPAPGPPTKGGAKPWALAVGLTVGGAASLGLLGGMIGLREAQVASVKAGLPSPAAVVSAVELANAATGLAVGAGVLGAGLLGVGISLLAMPAPSPKPMVGLRLVPTGVLIEGRY
jgi:hypothetical protein